MPPKRNIDWNPNKPIALIDSAINSVEEKRDAKNNISDSRTSVKNRRSKNNTHENASKAKDRNSNSSITKNRTSISDISKKEIPPKPRGVNASFHKIIRDYLYNALGDADEVEIKISEMQKELGMNRHTVFKHINLLRDTEFRFTRLRYSTLLERINNN